MTAPVERRAAPSLLAPRDSRREPAARGAGALLDLMHDGFYMLFLLRNGSAPPPAASELMEKITGFLDDFERAAKQSRADGDDIEAAKYAYCAAVDEIILASDFSLRAEWERRPLQLLIFGDQLAGEHFFERLDALRGKGGARLQALQVFHMCLLLGFQGKYTLGGAEKLGYLSARLGDEIAHIKGKSCAFAPRAGRPDQVVHKRRGGLPLWALTSLFALIAVSAYLGLKSSLTRATMNSLAAYADLIKLAPRPANLTITLP